MKGIKWGRERRHHLLPPIPGSATVCMCLLTYQTGAWLWLWHRCLRSVRRGAHRQSAREVAVCSGGICSHTVSQSTDTLRQAAATTAVTAHRVGTSDWTAVLRPTRRQNTHRDTHQGHAAQRRLIQLALHAHAVALAQTGQLASGTTKG